MAARKQLRPHPASVLADRCASFRCRAAIKVLYSPDGTFALGAVGNSYCEIRVPTVELPMVPVDQHELL